VRTSVTPSWTREAQSKSKASLGRKGRAVLVVVAWWLWGLCGENKDDVATLFFPHAPCAHHTVVLSLLVVVLSLCRRGSQFLAAIDFWDKPHRSYVVRGYSQHHCRLCAAQHNCNLTCRWPRCSYPRILIQAHSSVGGGRGEEGGGPRFGSGGWRGLANHHTHSRLVQNPAQMPRGRT
jgi:hypothetical protein